MAVEDGTGELDTGLAAEVELLGACGDDADWGPPVEAVLEMLRAGVPLGFEDKLDVANADDDAAS